MIPLSERERHVLRIALRWRMAEMTRMMRYHAGGYTDKRKAEYEESRRLYWRLTQTEEDMSTISYNAVATELRDERRKLLQKYAMDSEQVHFFELAVLAVVRAFKGSNERFEPRLFWKVVQS